MEMKSDFDTSVRSEIITDKITFTFIPVCRIEMGKLGSGLELSQSLNCGSISSLPGRLKLKTVDVKINTKC